MDHKTEYKIELLWEKYNHIINREYYDAQQSENWDDVIKYAKQMKSIKEKIKLLKNGGINHVRNVI